MSYYQAKDKLLTLLATQAYEFRDPPFKLRSGQMSNHYIDARKVTLSAQGAAILGALVYEQVRILRADAVGGPSIGADPIVAATLIAAHNSGEDLQGFIARKEPKAHGLGGLIAGPPLCTSMKVILVDDVLTTGASLDPVVDELQRQGIIIGEIFTIVRRGNEASEHFWQKGCIRVYSLFELNEIIRHAEKCQTK